MTRELHGNLMKHNVFLKIFYIKFRNVIYYFLIDYQPNVSQTYVSFSYG